MFSLIAVAILINLASAHRCQTWCYYITPNRDVTYKCCNLIEKPGSCPNTYCQFPKRLSYIADFKYIKCCNDWECPDAFKCCYDECIKQKICRRVRTHIIKEDADTTTLGFIKTETTTESGETTTDSLEITTENTETTTESGSTTIDNRETTTVTKEVTTESREITTGSRGSTTDSAERTTESGLSTTESREITTESRDTTTISSEPTTESSEPTTETTEFSTITSTVYSMESTTNSIEDLPTIA